MAEISTIRVILKEGQCFHNIAIASYGMLSGISILSNWQFRENQEIDLMNLFKVTLSNVHMQNTCFYDDIPCSRIDAEDITVFSSIFVIPVNNRMTPHCIAFFIESKYVKKSPYITNLIYKRLHLISLLVKSSITENDFIYANLTPDIRSIALSCIFVFEAGIDHEKIEFNTLFLNDITFYAACLQSHLQTQMVTVIETDNENNAKLLFDLLSFFLLPEQRKLSSRKIHEFPVPGLFLQCISPQSEIPYPEFFQFTTPITYVRLNEKTIFSSNNCILQNMIANEYAESILFAVNLTEEEHYVRMSKLKKQYSMEEIIKPAESIINILKSFGKVPLSFCPVICQQKLAELVQQAVLIIEISNSMVEQSKSKYLSSTQKMIISELLQNLGKEEMKMITAIAQMFDEKFYQRFYSGRQEVFKQMIVTI
ncbi:hypothetical protein TRFO_16766 [Tritrichomonas foetus]|uniref:Uncharacterized protein n=1 Tax=Tritrichomonas foetus TaxID=1144522 RepID=A0A1J4KQ12_9EUKA|nr:hypothetical protein TRFO_16766 [Tritrichomonas foetus]|eukprot:OHT13202.1 hypothetical protein TRFO_16766 [Tritrichomonas foetus]